MVKFWLSDGIYIAAVCLIHAALISAVVVTSTGPQTVKKAKGESVSLGCTYTTDASDTGDLDIEWTLVSQDMTQKDQMILSYTGGKQYELGSPDLMRRLKFVSDPSGGDATVNITNLQVSDTATYQCKVKKTPGVDSIKVTLVVLVRPSRPKCWVDGSEEKGGSVSLRCRSNQGSSPLKYTWTKESGSLPPTSTQNSQTGELLITNHSDSYRGKYVCEVSNEVGSEQCTYALQAYNPTNKAGVIAGAVIGALLLLLLLIFLILLLICCCCRKRDEKDAANEIREDAAAPESQPGSRNPSFRSVTRYNVHPGIKYTSVKPGSLSRVGSGHSSTQTERSRAQREASMLSSDQRPPLRYDSKYGYPV
ncbi:hypothetical protein DNTS_004197 [Danionella cerebrum]|uniref:Ig-like domain-containing protein n=1 Tax=Danionella cerebrum TaxID=2873325 RepID=A0A553Q923_9TELE|nr:hypothetical protein DNTS_004197 [Danionella translucida]